MERRAVIRPWNGVLVWRIVCLLACLMLASPATAQDGIALLERQLDEIEASVSAIRRLYALEETRVRFLSREEAAADLERLFHREYPPELLETLYHVYLALDLAEPGLDLGGLLREFMFSRIAGYYDAESATMTIILPGDQLPVDGLAAPQQITYAHEFAHALQDQHYDLSALADVRRDTDSLDYRLALSALVEGDAMLVSGYYYDRLLAQNQEKTISEMEAAARAVAEPPEDLPPIVEAEIRFAYFDGTEFAAMVTRQSNWADINQALHDMPILTAEHIFYPERFLASETPIPFDPPDLSAIADDSWELVYDNSVGEFYLRQHLRTQFTQDNAARISQGWGGDRLQIYVNASDDEIIWAWHHVWDTEKDAERFSAGYRSFLDWRYGAYSEDPQCWIGKMVRCAIRYDSDETRITVASDIATARALLALRR